MIKMSSVHCHIFFCGMHVLRSLRSEPSLSLVAWFLSWLVDLADWCVDELSLITGYRASVFLSPVGRRGERRPYDIVATSPDAGIIEAIPDTVSLDALKKVNKNSRSERRQGAGEGGGGG